MKSFTIELIYGDYTSSTFIVVVDGEEWEYMAKLSMITRGTLMASNARRAVCWKDEEHSVCSFVK